MDFGYVDAAPWDTIDFSLPKDSPLSGKILNGKPCAFRTYIGMSKWGRKEYIGKLYPKGIRERDFLSEYVRHFNAVELNATHFKIYTPEEISKWAVHGQGIDFKFCPKLAQSISHYSSLIDDRAKLLTEAFITSIRAFGDNLGPAFITLSDKYSPKRKENLLKFIHSLPRDIAFHLEVRHTDWFTPSVSKELFSHMYSAGVGSVICDTPGRRDVLHMTLTTPILFLRFVCDGNNPKDFERIGWWKQRIADWKQTGLKEAYIFLHCHNYDYEADFAQHVQQMFQDM